MPKELLCEALSVAFQASLTLEEARPTRFRLLLMRADDLPEAGAANQGVLRLRFDHSRPLQADELRRLSPSVPFETSLIGAHVEEERLRIWGVAHSGPAWLAPTWGGRSVVPNWTYDPIIHVTGPGQLAVRCAGKLVGAIERGMLVDAMMDVFDSEWLPAMFEREREQVRAEHAALQARTSSPTVAEHSLIGRVGQHMLRRDDPAGARRRTRRHDPGGRRLVVCGCGWRWARAAVSTACGSSIASIRTSRRTASERCCSRSWSGSPPRLRRPRSAGRTSRSTPARTSSGSSRRCSS